MEPDRLAQQAADNLLRLERNPYPGRGIVLGRSHDGSRYVQIYWIMGRSANSRNRKFEEADGRVRTAALDPARMERPELVIYTAMDRHGNWHVVTNGDQTDTVVEALGRGQDYRDALRTRQHEPDAPHFTPRIAGGIDAADGCAWLAVLKSDPHDPQQCLRQYFEFEGLPAGFGWCVHTYMGDGNPLPSFAGEPYPVPLEGSPDEAMNRIWGRLDTDNRISMAMKVIEPGSGQAAVRIVNKYLPTG